MICPVCGCLLFAGACLTCRRKQCARTPAGRRMTYQSVRVPLDPAIAEAIRLASDAHTRALNDVEAAYGRAVREAIEDDLQRLAERFDARVVGSR